MAISAWLNRMLLRGVLPRVGAALLSVTAAAVVALVVAAVLRAPVAPDPRLLPQLALHTLPTALNLGGPLAVLGGVTALAVRWRQDGVWSALSAAGVRGRALLPATAAGALGVVGICWVLGHHLEPAARAQAAQLAEGLHPRAGRVVQLGGLALTASEVQDGVLEGVVFAVERGAHPLVGHAERGVRSGGQLTLERVQAHWPGSPELGPPELGLWAERVTVRAPARRVEGVERSDEALARRIAQMRARGRDPWAEEALLHKRDAWPVGAGLLVLLTPPLALAGRTALVLLSPLIWWSLVRAFDQLGGSLGGLGVAWGPPALLALGVVAAWAGWRER